MKPGVYDISAEKYHADPALSSSGARKLLPPSCPAVFDYERRQPPPKKKREFDLGTAAHTLLLGNGAEPDVIDAENYLTKAAKKDRDAAYARGDVPLLPHEFDAVQAMIGAVRRHKRAAELLSDGMPEQSLFWTDVETGVPCRARLDWLRPDGIVDYKTTTSVDSDHIAKVVADFGYHCQGDWYLDAAAQLEVLPPDAPFYLIFQVKTPPHLVRVVELDETALSIGRDRNMQAREVFRDCTAAGTWPGPGDEAEIELISLPRYQVRRHYEGMFA